MLTAGAGDCYSRVDVSRWLAGAGVQPLRFAEVAETSGILVGIKR